MVGGCGSARRLADRLRDERWGVRAGGGIFPTVFAAFVGAVIVIIAQRKLWHTARLGM